MEPEPITVEFLDAIFEDYYEYYKLEQIFKKYCIHDFKDGSFEFMFNVNKYFEISGLFQEDRFDILIEPTEKGIDKINESDLDWYLSKQISTSFNSLNKFVKFLIDFYDDLINHDLIFNKGFYYTLRRYKKKYLNKSE